MVTTNSTAVEEVRDLFRRALGLAKDLVGDTDEAETQLHQTAVRLFKLAVKAVVPVLKYVDKEIDLGESAEWRCVRGVELARGLILTREGRILKEDFSREQDLDVFLFHGSTDDTVDEVIEHLSKLAKIFNEALRKMDRRRKSIDDRRGKLDEAIAPFRRDSSS